MHIIPQQMEKKDVTLIDVRGHDEIRDNGGILTHAGVKAQTIPLEEFSSALQMETTVFKQKYGFSKPNPVSDAIVLTCRSGKRSAVACVEAEARGYRKVFNHEGGAMAWHSENQ
jgi:rhodanese-related sulfurtransferase